MRLRGAVTFTFEMIILGEFGSLLIRLLNDGIFYLAVDPLVLVNSVDLYDRAAVGRSLLDLWRVRDAVLEYRLVVVDIRDEDDDHGCGRV